MGFTVKAPPWRSNATLLWPSSPTRFGFAEFWYGEHHSGAYELSASPELIIAAAAQRTKRIKLGAGVVSLPYHNPLMMRYVLPAINGDNRNRQRSFDWARENRDGFI